MALFEMAGMIWIRGVTAHRNVLRLGKSVYYSGSYLSFLLASPEDLPPSLGASQQDPQRLHFAAVSVVLGMLDFELHCICPTAGTRDNSEYIKIPPR